MEVVRIADVADLARARKVVAAMARGVLGSERSDNLILAVSEIATNALHYAATAGRPAVLTVQHLTAGLRVIVTDRGPGFTPPAGYTLPRPEDEGGRGLWLAHQMCDRLRITSTSAGTTVVMDSYADKPGSAVS
ncbi:MAG: ATP-binding protein [Catenulispora sp.]|nr:ATP-binding protein [Catenulispora sp.]